MPPKKSNKMGDLLFASAYELLCRCFSRAFRGKETFEFVKLRQINSDTNKECDRNIPVLHRQKKRGDFRAAHQLNNNPPTAIRPWLPGGCKPGAGDLEGERQ